MPSAPGRYGTIREEQPVAIEEHPTLRTPVSAATPVDLVREVIALTAQFAAFRSDVEARFAKLEATNRSETIKILAGAVVTVVLGIVGARATAPTPPPTTTVIQRSAFDRALDACRSLQDAPAQSDCIVRTIGQSVK